MADAVIHLMMPGFESPRSDLPSTVHFVGPLFSPGRAPGDRSPDEQQPDEEQPDEEQPDEEQPDDLPGWVVVTTGGPAVDTLPQPLPANVRAAPFLPYDTGVPLVVAGATEDKVEVSARIGWSV